MVPGLPPAPRADFGPRPDGTYAYRGSGHHGQVVDRNHGAVERVPPPRTPETLIQRVSGYAWDGAWEAARLLPTPAAFGLARAGAGVVRRVRDDRIIRKNLARVVAPEQLDEAVEAAHQSWLRYYMEAFRADSMDPAWLDQRTTTEGFEHLDAVLEQGRGAIILLAHHGSWDIAARWAESHGYHLACVAEVLRPRRLFHKFVVMRESLGLEIVPLRRGDDITGRLSKVLTDNHLVGLLTDRDLTGKAPLVEMFGEPVRVPPGAALLNKRTGAPIVPITMLHRPEGRYHLQILPPLETDGLGLREAVQVVTHGIEDIIRLAPEQWHAFHPIFEADREETA